MRSFRIERRAVQHALGARVPALVSIALLAVAWQATFISTAGASEPTAPQSKRPSASTGASHASGSAVTLEGTVDPRGEATTYFFQYGPTVSYGEQTPSASLPASTAKVRVSQTVTGLQTGSHYRLVAMNASGTTEGLDRTYTSKTVTKKTTKQLELKFTLVKPPAEGQVVGSPVTITGTLSGPGAIGHQVILQSSPYPSGRIFANVGAPQTISSTGRFSFSAGRLRQSTRYRVAAVGPQPTYSSVITELATVRVTLHVRSAPHAGLVRLYGTVSPAVTGAVVYFQLQEAAKSHPRLTTPKSQKAEEKAEERAEERAETPRFATEFSAPVKRATKTLSRFSLVTNVRKSGLYRAYVQVPRGPLASGHSTSITLHATGQAKKRRKG